MNYKKLNYSKYNKFLDFDPQRPLLVLILFQNLIIGLLALILEWDLELIDAIYEDFIWYDILMC